MVRPCAADQASSLRVLSFTLVFPHPLEPGRGLFVRRRLEAIAGLADVRVVAPVSYLLHSKGRLRPSFEVIFKERSDGGMEVSHPRWFHIPMAGSLNGTLLALQTRRLVRRIATQWRPHLLDVHFGYPDAIAGAKLAAWLGLPFTVTLRGSELDHAAYPKRRAAMSNALRRASFVFANSSELQRLAISLGVPADKTLVVPNGVDSSLFYLRNHDSIRQELKVQPGEFMILSAGHLIELKGHHHVIQAVANLRATGIPATLLIAGGAAYSPSYPDHLRQLVDELGLSDSVRFLGNLPPEQLARMMNAADVFCLASRREGWPNVLHEALSCGTPAVATDVGAVRDLLPDERYGIVVEPGSSEQITAALRRAFTMQWKHADIAAWAQSRSWSQAAQDVLTVWRSVLGFSGDY